MKVAAVSTVTSQREGHGCLHVLPVCVWVLCGCSCFLQKHAREMVWNSQRGRRCLCQCERVFVFLCGPAINCQLVRGVNPPLARGRLVQAAAPRARRELL